MHYINTSGTKIYRNDKGQYHREDGPAIEFINGDKRWYKNSLLHREDGPAIECHNGAIWWYYNGIEIYCNSNEEFLKIIKLKAFW